MELLRDKSKLTFPEISTKLGISTRSVVKHIHTLKEAGRLERKGARKNGW
ncbi:HTH domain-containing protein [Acidobacteriota bacterium]